MKSYKNVNEYLKSLAKEKNGKEMQTKFTEIWVLAKNIVEASELKITEEIKYGIPTFVLHQGKKNKNLFHVGVFKTHVSIFPGPKVVAKFAKELEKFETSKGTIKFPLEKKLPITLVKKIIKSCLV